MFVDSLIVPQCVYRPGSFTGLMTIYESNYVKLDMLTGGFAWTGRSMLSSSARDHDLHAEVMRREPYTTTLRLTYLFEEGASLLPDPDLILRIYHDARLVEAVASRERHLHHRLREWARSASNAELDRRWRLNMMLNKWLDYLSDVGHNLATASEPRS